MIRRRAPALLALLACAAFAPAARAQTDVELSVEEKAFLAGKRLRLGVDSARPPFEYLDERGAYSGISAGFITECARRLGVAVTPVPGFTVKEAVDKLNAGELDVIPKVTPTPERAKSLLFTTAYAAFPSVIVTRANARFAAGLDDLAGLKVGVLKGLVVEELLTRDRPGMPLIPLPDVRTALLDLSTGKIDAFIDNLGTVSWNIDKLGLTNLKIAAPTQYTHELAFGVRKDWPLLASALNKVLAGMSNEEKYAIKSRWLAVEFKQGVDWKSVGPVGALLLLVVGFVLVWNRRLGRAVAAREVAQAALKEHARELEATAGAKSRLSQITALLQKAETLGQLGETLLSFLAPAVNAQSGLLHVAEGNTLRAVAGYAQPLPARAFAIGEGLVGQCAAGQKAILLAGGDGVRIRWGSGEAAAASLLFQPVAQSGQVLGVIELASLTSFSPAGLALLEELMPILSMNIEILSRNLHTVELKDEAERTRRQMIELSNSLPLAVFQVAIAPGGAREVLFVSEKVFEVLGVTAEQVKGDIEALFRHIHPEDVEGARKLVSSDRTGPGEARFRVLVGGSEHWVLAGAEAKHLPDGSTLWNGYSRRATPAG
jgi:ABC-type amino acid transport substrate-binding protein